VRRYAVERLEEIGRATEATRSHLAYYTELVGAAELRGPAIAEGLHRLDAEIDNIRAALDAAAALGDPEVELRLVGSLGRYWWIRGLLTEGRARIDAALARGSGLPASLRANALHRAAGLAYAQDDYESARSMAMKALEAARASGDVYAEISAHTVIGGVAMEQEDFTAAQEHHSASLALAEEHGLADDVRTAKVNLGIVAVYSGDSRGAVQILGEILEAARGANNLELTSFVQLHLGLAAYELGDDEAARASWDEARVGFVRLDFPQHIGHALQGLAALDARAGQHASAARLLGTAAGALGRAGALAGDAFGSRVAVRAEAEARAQLGDDAFTAAFEEGMRSAEFAG